MSGLSLAWLEGCYFGVGGVEKGRVEDYARRKGREVATAERWLGPALNCEAG